MNSNYSGFCLGIVLTFILVGTRRYHRPFKRYSRVRCGYINSRIERLSEAVSNLQRHRANVNGSLVSLSKEIDSNANMLQKIEAECLALRAVHAVVLATTERNQHNVALLIKTVETLQQTVKLTTEMLETLTSDTIKKDIDESNGAV